MGGRAPERKRSVAPQVRGKMR
ncbi:MAG: hypothetical protein DMG86_11530 [Acidobacteria bacterium]|nr:MAG: hypothetical protein DMG86_11530 [Acidobacteriota bacterium]PYX12435.1 MAG: hypothetical protein DMG85_02445 [Acidobacteriota bacterium]PYX14512.1 MAG: hypothetical protein DMG84_14975 [Acidobacteriota bacterium]